MIAAAAAIALLAVADVAAADTGLGTVPTPEAAAAVTSQVAPVTQAVQPVVQTTQPVAVPVAEAAAPAVEPVNDAAAPVTQKVAEATAPVVQAAAPVTEAVAEVAAPVVDATVETTAPVVETVTQTAAPVVEQASETVAPVVETVTQTAAPSVGEAAEVAVPVVDTAAASAPAVAASDRGSTTTVGGTSRVATDALVPTPGPEQTLAASVETASPSVAPATPAIPVAPEPTQPSIGRGEGAANELPAAVGSSVVEPDATAAGALVAEPRTHVRSVETTRADGRGTSAAPAPAPSSDAARTIGLGLVGGLLVIGAGIATLSSAATGGQASSSTALTTRPYRLVAPALRWRLRALTESVKPTPFVSLLELPG